ncbi:MAG: hypothetical protein IT434_18070 [Phycisphaerales bacterium]|nr:hypothetical protein [Phycisphaerales bacterium]
MEKNTAKQTTLPIPGAVLRTDSQAEPQNQLFLSPELKVRAGEFPPLNIPSAKLPETIRVNLTVRMDGTVESAFFETPITNTALLSAIRLLPFKPAKEKSEGWIDIRFPQERK